MSITPTAIARAALAVAAALSLGCLPKATVTSAPLRLEMVTHAAFFSAETNQNPPLDPHVFVRDAAAPAARGPQNIDHVTGVRPALLSDQGSLPIHTALNVPLPGFTLGSWLGARGTVTIVPTGAGGSSITVDFTGLRPGGVYSLFENHFDQQPVGFTPLDGAGTGNNFTASAQGTARITVSAPDVPTHDNAVLLVYHSDGMTHGTQRGAIGVTAHHQLIARIP